MNKYSSSSSWPGCLFLAWHAGRWNAVYEALFPRLFITSSGATWKDVETTRRSCEKFRLHPTTMLISLKAPVSRKKNISKPTPLSKLVATKGGRHCDGAKCTGKQFDKLLNVTLCYPDNNRQPSSIC